MKEHRLPTRSWALSSSIAVLVTSTMLCAPVIGHAKERSGREVVTAVCAACHTAGKDNAPRIGDARAWSPRASQGLTSLTAHALTGIRKMPAHGGNAGVSDLEIQRAIAYMVNQSGGHWVEPQDSHEVLVRTSEAIVQNQCASCHKDGKDGAPKIGDRNAWTQRMSKGLDMLVANAVHGHGPMPARGGMPELSSQDIRGAVIYMFNYGAPLTLAAPVTTAPPDPHHQVVAGTDVYFGMMRAEAVPAATNAPSGKGFYHLNISLADNKTHKPLKDALVTMSVSDGMSIQTKTLEPLVANAAVSWGNYFKFDSGSAYNITANIKRTGLPDAIVAKFEFKAP
jgi:cytochrome c5